jgi:hypothetical protein
MTTEVYRMTTEVYRMTAKASRMTAKAPDDRGNAERTKLGDCLRGREDLRNDKKMSNE